MYRLMVLQHGASRPEADIVHQYLEKEPNADAYYSELSGCMDGKDAHIIEPSWLAL